MSGVWLSANEIAEMMNVSPRTIYRKAAAENWQSRIRAGGGCKEFLTDARSARAATQQSVQSSFRCGAAEAAPSFLWQRWEQATDSQRRRAGERAKLLLKVASLVSAGASLRSALAKTAGGVSRQTLQRGWYAVRNHPQSDWQALMLPAPKPPAAKKEFSDEAWEFFKSDYLRLEQPTVSACYLRLKRVAAERGWTIPSERTFARWVDQKIPATARVLARQGEVALRRSHPSVERDKSKLAALEWINGDGYLHNVFVKFGNKVIRPKTWFWQDVHSGKILAYRSAETETSCQIRLAFADLLSKYGIPSHITIDNTRAAANKFLTGGVPNRYRFKVKADDPLGLFPLLGIQVHWSSVVSVGHRAFGWGQAKPVERVFGVGGFGEMIDKHPAFAGAYTGAAVDAKPENYSARAVAFDDFKKVVAAEVAEWNARQGRRSPVCAGRSFDETFAASYGQTEIRKATEEQRRMFLLSAEHVKVRCDATVAIGAANVPGFPQTRYHAAELYEHTLKGRSVTVRFDPDSLHEPVHIYKQSGEFLCAAEPLSAAGFGDVETARKVNRERRSLVKAERERLAAEERLSAAELADALRGVSGGPPEDPQTAVVRMIPAAAPAAKPAAQTAQAEVIDWESCVAERGGEEELTAAERLFEERLPNG